MATELTEIVNNAEVGKKYDLPKYNVYGYTSLSIYFSNGEYYLVLTQPATVDYVKSYKRIGDAKKHAKKLIKMDCS